MGSPNHLPFLAIIMATIDAQRTLDFLANLKRSCDNPGTFEVHIKIDTEDQQTYDELNKKLGDFPFVCKLYQLPKEKGYFSLHHGYNAMLAELSSSIYFCTILTDEVRFETKGWDSILQTYIGMYEDDIFRIKISNNKNRNYQFFADCYYQPDNYPIITKKWLQLVGGWGNFWGPDSWLQCIDYYLGKCPTNKIPFGIYRSIPDYDIKLSGTEASQGVSGPSLVKRWRMSENARILMLSDEAEESFNYLAKRLHIAIMAREKGLTQVLVKDNRTEKRMIISSDDGENDLFTFDYGVDSEPLQFGIRGVYTRIKIYSFLCKLFGDRICWWVINKTKPSWDKLNLYMYYLARGFNIAEDNLKRVIGTSQKMTTNSMGEEVYRIDFDKLDIIPFNNTFTRKLEALK